MLDLARVQRGVGDDAVIVALRAPDALDREAVEVGPGTRWLGLLWGAGKARAIGCVSRCDVLHLHGLWDPVMVQLAGAARRCGVPYVVTVHGMLNDWCMAQRGVKKRAYLSLCGRQVLDRAHAVIVSSAEELAQAGRWFTNPHRVILEPVMSLETYLRPSESEGAIGASGSLGIDRRRPFVLFLSRLHPKKGVECLIDAAGMLHARGVDVPIVVAGTGVPEYEESLRDRVRGLGLGGTVRFVGGVHGEEKRRLYADASMLVLPSHQENFGLVLIEAMACGTPVVTTRGVDIWREIEASGGGVVVEREAGAIAGAIESLLSDGVGRAMAGRRAQDWVRSRFDAQAGAARFREVYVGSRAGTG